MTAHQERMSDHWWWRPGWSVGRRFYTWHLTFDGQSDVHRFADAYRRALAPAGGLDLIPDRWLHLTMQGIGFIDEVPEDVVEEITKAAAQRLAALPAFGVTFHAPVIDPEAILVPVQPAEPVRALRSTIRGAMGDVLADVPEQAEGFLPHVSIGYSNSDGPTAPYAEAIASADVPPAKALITHADLIVIHRDNRMYEWTTLAQVPLG
ncbi:2'-5' RNA ligase family protein [Streptomyces sp. HPF1205]|uniref:2'-5' RNA ligase family protein n=1 Tax=Streptomyces sp. HPF1205 TaxID=2873262 RepID=UPI001CEC5DEA|nr:2'-5' RNA ligase family protein [Streptomyces sp. HPF1205]